MVRRAHLQRRLRVAAALALTLLELAFVPISWLLALLLPLQWWWLLRPFTRRELLLGGLAALFFIGQNYTVLRAGAFVFEQRDFLLMPYYEPPLWAFWYLVLVRWVDEPPNAVPLQARAGLGLLLTVIAFSGFAGDSRALTGATLVSTAGLVALFRERGDFVYGGCALALGVAVEAVGLLSGRWFYPQADFLGLPYWFAAMWYAVGVLGRRVGVPLVELALPREVSHAT